MQSVVIDTVVALVAAGRRPRFEDARFELGANQHVTLEITLRYYL